MVTKKRPSPTAFRLEKVFLRQLDELATKLQRQHAGMSVSRTDALRVALIRGLEVLKKEGD